MIKNLKVPLSNKSRSSISLGRIIASIGLIGGLMFSSSFAQAEQKTIQLDISPSFEWSAKSIRKLASGTAQVYAKRCVPPCTINVRVMVKGSTQKISEQRLDWLRKSLIEEMGRRQANQVTVADKLLFV